MQISFPHITTPSWFSNRTFTTFQYLSADTPMLDSKGIFPEPHNERRVFRFSLSPREGRVGREPERGAARKGNLLSPTLSSLWEEREKKKTILSRCMIPIRAEASILPSPTLTASAYKIATFLQGLVAPNRLSWFRRLADSAEPDSNSSDPRKLQWYKSHRHLRAM